MTRDEIKVGQRVRSKLTTTVMEGTVTKKWVNLCWVLWDGDTKPERSIPHWLETIGDGE